MRMRCKSPRPWSQFLYELVLNCCVSPPSRSPKHRVAFVPESRQLVVESDLPAFEVIPPKKYRINRQSTALEELRFTAREASKRYLDLISQMALRTVHAVFSADAGFQLESAVYNGFVWRLTIDRQQAFDLLGHASHE